MDGVKRRKNVGENYKKPCPFPSSSFEGILNGKVVEIEDRRIAEELQLKGCYGKSPVAEKKRWLRKRQFKEKLRLRKDLEPSYCPVDLPYASGGETASTIALVVPDSDFEEEAPSPSAKSAETSKDEEGSGISSDKPSLEDCSWTADPFPLELPYFLSLEEAFFLSYGLGCLAVIKDGMKMSLRELWNYCLNSSSYFLTRYVAYHYYRSKGWVVRDGCNFAADYVLYKDGPAYCHSTFAVKVSTEESGIDEWRTLAALCRELLTAGKLLIDCVVVAPKDKQLDLRFPDCMREYTVKVRHISTEFLIEATNSLLSSSGNENFSVVSRKKGF